LVGDDDDSAGAAALFFFSCRSTCANALHSPSSSARTASGPGPVAAIDVDPMFHTGVPGLFAAGDVNSQVLPSVASAVAAGSSTAAMIVHGFSEVHGLTSS
jgi:thioredoxin reductase